MWQGRPSTVLLQKFCLWLPISLVSPIWPRQGLARGGLWRLIQGWAGSSASVLFCSPRQAVLPQCLAPASPWPECQDSLVLPCCNAHSSPPPHHSLQALPSPRESRDENFPGWYTKCCRDRQGSRLVSRTISEAVSVPFGVTWLQGWFSGSGWLGATNLSAGTAGGENNPLTGSS